jgi:hypothetical protein
LPRAHSFSIRCSRQRRHDAAARHRLPEFGGGWSRPTRDGENGVVPFESLDDGFIAAIPIDGRGLVLDYPGIARQIA